MAGFEKAKGLVSIATGYSGGDYQYTKIVFINLCIPVIPEVIISIQRLINTLLQTILILHPAGRRIWTAMLTQTVILKEMY